MRNSCIKQTPADRNLEAAAVLVLVLGWLLIAIKYSTLPETIPTHFNLRGAADSFANKTTIWLLPIITTTLYFLLTFINRYPHHFNYPTKITEANAERQYTLATRLIRILKLVMLAVFFILEYWTIQAALQPGQGLPTWFLPVALLLVLLPLIYYFNENLKK